MPIDVANLHRARQTPPERVVVTGVGMVTSIGIGKEIFWRNLLAGECGIGAVESFSTESYPVHCGAEIKNFAAEAFVYRFRKGEMGRASQFAIAAARLALQDADLSKGGMDPEQSGVAVGT